jgi:hypothetical protein
MAPFRDLATAPADCPDHRLNGDGWPDLIVMRSGIINVLLNEGSGIFRSFPFAVGPRQPKGRVSSESLSLRHLLKINT